jgi:UDP-glucuronate 4-epimerase
MQPGDVLATHADMTDLQAAVGFRPQTSIEEGVARFVDWYRRYYGIA